MKDRWYGTLQEAYAKAQCERRTTYSWCAEGIDHNAISAEIDHVDPESVHFDNLNGIFRKAVATCKGATLGNSRELFKLVHKSLTNHIPIKVIMIKGSRYGTGDTLRAKPHPDFWSVKDIQGTPEEGYEFTLVRGN